MGNANNIKKSSKKKGQVVFEYIMVSLIIVGFGMAAYVAIRKYVAKPLRTIKSTMEGNKDPMGKDAGSGGKNPGQYYQNVEYKTK
jgi:hypothetical protein